VKLFSGPSAFWLFVTRRLPGRCKLRAYCDSAVLLSWAAIDFAGFRSLPQLLRLLSRLEPASATRRSHSPFYGLSGSSATRCVPRAYIAILAVRYPLAGRGLDGDRRSFTVRCPRSLVVTPVLWLHYLVLLFVPIALYRPRLSPLWFVPLLSGLRRQGVPRVQPGRLPSYCW